MAKTCQNCSRNLRITHWKNNGADCFLFNEEFTPIYKREGWRLDDRRVNAAMEYSLRSSLMAR